MKTIYRSRNNEANIPRGTQVIYYEDWAIAAGFGFVLTFTALMFAAIKLGELVGLPADTWHAAFKSGFTYFDLALSCLVAWRFGRSVKPQRRKQNWGLILHEDEDVGGEGFQAMKAHLDIEYRADRGKASPLALAAPPGVDILSVVAPPYRRKKLFEGLFARSKSSDPFSLCAPLSDDRSRTHILVFGGTGSGKSLTIKPILHQALAVGHKLVILDKKGEYTEEIAEDLFALFGLHDRRQVQWDVARDLATVADVEQFLEGLIPVDQSQPYWGTSARLVGTALFAHLIRSKPGKWTLKDFEELCILPSEELAKLAAVAYSQAAPILQGEGQALASVLGNLAAFTAPLKTFAQEWDGSDYPLFSFSEWLDDPSPDKRCLIFQSGGRYSSINDPLIRGCLTYMAGYIDSPMFRRDSKETPRSLWFFCDEFQSFGKLDIFAKILQQRGRDKGARMVIGVQDISQLNETYGQDFVKFLMSNVGTTALAGANQGETVENFNKALGQLSFEKRHVSRSDSGKNVDDQDHNEDVYLTSEIIGNLGFTAGRTRVLYRLAKDKQAYIVHQPLIKYPRITEPTVPADWVLGIPRATKAMPVATAAQPGVSAAGGVASKASAQEVEQMLNEELPDEIDELPPGYEDLPDQSDGEDQPYYLDLDEMASPVASLAGASAIEHTLTLIDLLAQEKPKLKSAKTIDEIRQEVRRELAQLTR